MITEYNVGKKGEDSQAPTNNISDTLEYTKKEIKSLFLLKKTRYLMYFVSVELFQTRNILRGAAVCGAVL